MGGFDFSVPRYLGRVGAATLARFYFGDLSSDQHLGSTAQRWVQVPQGRGSHGVPGPRVAQDPCGGEARRALAPSEKTSSSAARSVDGHCDECMNA